MYAPWAFYVGIWALYNPKLPIWPLIGLPDLAGDLWVKWQMEDAAASFFWLLIDRWLQYSPPPGSKATQPASQPMLNSTGVTIVTVAMPDKQVLVSILHAAQSLYISRV